MAAERFGSWVYRQSRFRAPSSSPDLGSLVVTHPFHPLAGQCLPVLFMKRRGGALVVVCAGGGGGRGAVAVPVVWGGRGPGPGGHRVALDALGALAGLGGANV